MPSDVQQFDSPAVAVIGMACRFPGAADVDAFWRNLRGAVESIRSLSDDELVAHGLDPARLGDPDLVKAAATVDGIDLFDAAFFGVTPREAEVMDPQHRLLLECAWTALEHAGYDPGRYEGNIGVYTGGVFGSYMVNNLLPAGVMNDPTNVLPIVLSNEKDYLSTTVAYRLNLRGPAFTIQSGCSTSLVAAHVACQNLLNFETDIALAGGVAIDVGRGRGYYYQNGGIMSPDGHCRAFDVAAQGTVFSQGVGLVVLKRLDEAIADRDFIHAVILGSAINNDGSLKVGFTTPSVKGQSAVIAEAMADAGVQPETIGYVEAHGTGTALGDPVEIKALTEAFGEAVKKGQFCGIGSVKSNIGHSDAAAGVSGLIKAIQVLRHGELPPTLHVKQPNPTIEFEKTPFYVVTEPTPWPVAMTPRRAAVSAFGLGGTNAHMILEEAPTRRHGPVGRPHLLLNLSARTPEALKNAAENLAAQLRREPRLNLADVAYTLNVGRATFAQRLSIACVDAEQALTGLERACEHLIPDSAERSTVSGVVFLFPGHGTQSLNMGCELYEREPVFRREIDRVSELSRATLQLDLRSVLYPDPQQKDAAAAALLQRSDCAQVAVFAVDYALARLWMHWGVRPTSMIGYSVGELVAACLAGVFSLEDAVRFVSQRGKLMHDLPPGAMSAVIASVEQLEPYLKDGVEIGGVNAEDVSIISGPVGAIESVEQKLLQQGINSLRVPAARAFHSSMIEPAIEPTRQLLESISLEAPQIPILSTVTGDWLDNQQVTDPQYWATHARSTVQFASAVARLMQDEKSCLMIEVGPGQSLASLVRQQFGSAAVSGSLVTSLPDPRSPTSQQGVLVESLGRAWQSGVSVDWQRYYEGEERCRVPLTTYPFQRERYWVEPEPQAATPAVTLRDPNERFFFPTWMRSLRRRQTADAPLWSGCALILDDGSSLSRILAQELRQRGLDVVTVQPADSFRQSHSTYTIDPQSADSYLHLAAALREQHPTLSLIIHLWQLPDPAEHQADVHHWLERGFFSLLYLAQALAKRFDPEPIRLGVVTSGVDCVLGRESLEPAKATVRGPCRVIPQELPHISCCHLDVEPSAAKDSPEALARELLHELSAETAAPMVALRGGQRWVPTFEPVRLEANKEQTSRLKSGGVYLITGGLGGIGLVLAQYLTAKWSARVVLVSRKGLPPRDDWTQRASGEDKVARQIRTVQQMEAQGAEVLVCQADVCDERQLRTVVDEAISRFGGLDGVIHAAGVAGGGLIQLKTEQEARRVLAAKVLGTQALGRVLMDVELDFLVICSSLASLLGGIGQVDYCAANAYLDAFARDFQRQIGCDVVAINWNAWREVGMAVETLLPQGLEEMRQWILLNGISNEEGVDAFDRILACCDEPQIAVSSHDLQLLPRIEDAYARQSLAMLRKPPTFGETSAVYPRPDLPMPYVAPRDELEQTIADIWQAFFGIDQLGVDDDFFVLGGHSLFAAQVISRLRSVLQVELPMRVLFENPTIAGLAQRVSTLRKSADESVQRIPLATRRNGTLPLSYFQERQFFLSQMKPGSTADNLFFPLYWKGDLQTCALEAALREICQRHESMRTGFIMVDSQPRQVIHDHLPWHLPVVDLRGLPVQQRSSEVSCLIQAEATRPFDLAQAPLWRATIVHLDDHDYLLLFNIHHIVSDGWSLGVLGNELSHIYRARCEGCAAKLEELPIQYGDFAVWQRQWLESDISKKGIDYWRNKLADVPVLILPSDSPRPARQTFSGRQEPVEFSAELSEAIKQLSQTENASPFMTLLAAFDSLLYLYTGQTDIPVGTFVANRGREELEPLIGFFINNLVLRCDVSGKPTFRELLSRVRDVTLEAYAHQELPFEKLLDELQVERDPSRTPLFQVMLVFHNFPTAPLDLPNVTVHSWSAPLSGQETRSNFDLTLWMGEVDRRLMGYVDYNSDLFRQATIQRFLLHYKQLLNLIVADPDRSIDEYPCVSEQEREELRSRWHLNTEQQAGSGSIEPTDGTANLEQRRQMLDARRRALSAGRSALLERRLRGFDGNDARDKAK